MSKSKAAAGEDLGGSSKYSTESIEGWSGDGFHVNSDWTWVILIRRFIVSNGDPRMLSDLVWAPQVFKLPFGSVKLYVQKRGRSLR